MLSLSRSARRVMPALWQRAASTSATHTGAEELPYTYLAPGNSLKEPVYVAADAQLPKVHFYDGSSEDVKEATDEARMPRTGEHAAVEARSKHTSMEAAAPGKAKPTLTSTAKPRKPLAPQAGSEDAPFSYLPPGSSMQDPSYSLKDPVYHVDAHPSR